VIIEDSPVGSIRRFDDRHYDEEFRRAQGQARRDALRQQAKKNVPSNEKKSLVIAKNL
jgi:hypothetical protein